MKRLAAVLLLLAVPACGEGRTGVRAADACATASPSPGPVLLQRPDPALPRYVARTDGPCALLVSFTGAPEGDGPCRVAEYVGRVEPVGTSLRLEVDDVHTGEQPDGATACAEVGALRSFRVELDAPLDGRRVVDGQDHLLHLVDGDQLLRPGALPDGWTRGHEGDTGLPVHWSTGLRGPGDAWAELRQGDAPLGRPDAPPKGFGFRVLERPQVRGVEGVLAVFAAEPSGNHVLHWVQGDRGFALQALGRLPDPGVLVEIAEGLVPAP